MSDIDQLAENISGVADKINEAASVAVGVVQEAEDAVAVAEMLGSQPLADGLVQVKEELDGLAVALEAASAEARRIQASARNVGRGSGSGFSIPAVASSDPAAVPKQPAKKPPSPRGKANQRIRSLTEKGDGVSDLATYTEKVVDGAEEFFKGGPKPPAVTGTGTRTADSPPMASPAASAGADVPTAAGGLATLGLLFFGGKHAVRSTIRGIRAEEQTPEEVSPPSRTRYPWEDEPRSGTR